MARDPAQIIDNGRMGLFQIVAVTVCVLLNALDGFDVLSISFASPGISAEFGLEGGALGTVLAAELFGMALGSVMLGRIADGIGRRPTMLICVTIMAAGMAAVYYAQSIAQILAFRVLTGLGIGGMLACTNAMVAEFSNNKNRAFSVMIMAGGYPMGAVLGGMFVGAFFPEPEAWRGIFAFGAIATIAMLPVIYFLLPESVGFLSAKRRPGALQKINATLVRMGHTPINELPEPAGSESSKGFAALFKDGMAIKTFLMTIAYFAHILTFYFIIKWIPKLVVEMNQMNPGLGASPGDVLVWANIGGATGAIVLGLLTRKFNLWPILFGTLLGAFAMVVYFGLGQETVTGLKLVAAVTGFFTNAAIVALYALFAIVYPPESRAGGTGFVIGVGRGGAALAPIVGGIFLGLGLDLSIVAIIMGSGSLVALAALVWLSLIHRDGSQKSAFSKRE